MRRTKITAFIALTAVFVFFFILSFTPRAEGRRLERGQPDAGGPVVADFIGLGGSVFRPGQNVEIKWTLEGDGVKYFETNPWSECELFFSPDGGNTWTRITPQLSVSRRSYDWTVPNVFSRQGVIGLQIGIEGEGEFYIFPSEPFMVLGRR